MEIVLGIIVVLVILVILGKLKGAPNPGAMSEAAIAQRIYTESAWISKYLRQSFSAQQKPSLKRMYDEKTAYIAQLKNELANRQIAQGTNAAVAEMAPIIQRAAELMKEGKSESEAHAIALKEWNERNH